MRLSNVDDEGGMPPIEGRPSRWLALTFVALLSILGLMGTIGVGAAAATLPGRPEIVRGGRSDPLWSGGARRCPLLRGGRARRRG